MNTFRKFNELIKHMSVRSAVRFMRASKKSVVQAPHLSTSAKVRIANELGIGKEARRIAVFSQLRYASGFALVALLIAGQFARPGTALYFIKERTEDVREVVDPGFREERKQRLQQDDSSMSNPEAEETEDQSKDEQSGDSGHGQDDKSSSDGDESSGNNEGSHDDSNDEDEADDESTSDDNDDASDDGEQSDQTDEEKAAEDAAEQAAKDAEDELKELEQDAEDEEDDSSDSD